MRLSLLCFLLCVLVIPLVPTVSLSVSLSFSLSPSFSRFRSRPNLARKSERSKSWQSKVRDAAFQLERVSVELREFVVRCDSATKRALCASGGKRPNVEAMPSADETIAQQQATIQAESKELQMEKKKCPHLISVTEEEMKSKYENVKKAFDERNSIFRSARSQHQKMTESVEARKVKWFKYRHNIAKMANRYFNSFLEDQKLTGKISIDFERETLALIVYPTESDRLAAESQGASAGPSDAKCLSGGERSVVTCSFVMALLKSIDTPFMALDEFDCFLDSINRKRILDLLLAAASRLKNRQFFFLTPQDAPRTSNWISSNIKIFRLKKQDDLQKTIQFGEEKEEE